MKLIIDGDINKYYIQMLYMIFFPGATFGEDEVESPDNPTLEVKATPDDNGIYVYAELRYNGKICSSKKFVEFAENVTKDRTMKLATGAAVLAAAGDLTGYHPSWGMLTGVRPSKVATELLLSGMSKTRVKRTITGDISPFPRRRLLPQRSR